MSWFGMAARTTNPDTAVDDAHPARRTARFPNLNGEHGLPAPKGHGPGHEMGCCTLPAGVAAGQTAPLSLVHWTTRQCERDSARDASCDHDGRPGVPVTGPLVFRVKQHFATPWFFHLVGARANRSTRPGLTRLTIWRHRVTETQWRALMRWHHALTAATDSDRSSAGVSEKGQIRQ